MSHLSPLKLQQMRLGELPAEQQQQAALHIADCDLCSSRLGDIQLARQEFMKAPVPEWAREKPSPFARVRQWWMAMLLVPAMAAGFLTLKPEAPPTIDVGAETSEPGIRLKGDGEQLEVWVQTGDSPRPLYQGESLGGGAKVQLRFHPGGHRFVTLAGRDSRGTVEVYGTLASKGAMLQPAPFALTLDDSKGEQIFYAILTNIKPDPALVQSALGQNPVRMERASVTSVVIRKKE